MQLTKKTSLQKIDSVVKETMEWKLQQLKDNNLPVEQGLADYISLGMNGIDNEIEQLNNYVTTIKDKIAELEANKEDTSHKIALWLQDTGLDKINGLSVSSITINKAKESEQKTTTKKEWVCKMSDEDIKELLIVQGLGSYKDVSVVSTSKATIDKIKINKKRK